MMFQVLIQMAALILCGIGWRIARPLGIDADGARRVLTGLVYTLLLPALVLDVLWKAPLGLDSGRIALSAICGILGAMGIAWLIYRLTKTTKVVAGALILASAFPNATYMGLPVLEQLLGPQGRSIALQYDLFACTPILLSLGILLAAAYGEHHERAHPLKTLLKVPPLWAALLAVALNLAEVPLPTVLDNWLNMLGVAVVPLMLIALGMSLQWSHWKNSYLPLLLPALLLQLMVMPLIVMNVAQWIGVTGDLLIGITLEAAMPTMVLGLVLCDRYGLNTGLYAIAVTVSTALTLITLPLWHGWASA
jgi:malate permease and related proteins